MIQWIPMKSIFVATSFKHQNTMRDVLNTIHQTISDNGYEPFIFIDHYTFDVSETALMMKTSFEHIRACDIFIAELTHKVVGVGIEAGYAFAQNKPIIYLHQDQASLSTTMTGIANYRIGYANISDLSEKLGHLLGSIKHNADKDT